MKKTIAVYLAIVAFALAIVALFQPAEAANTSGPRWLIIGDTTAISGTTMRTRGYWQ